MRPPGVAIGEGLHVIDRTPHHRRAHVIELSNGSLIFSDGCKLWDLKSRIAWVEAAASVYAPLPYAKTLEALQTLDGVAAAEAPAESAPDGDSDLDPRPWLDVANGDLAALTKEAWAAVTAGNDPPSLFRYGGLIARLDHDEDEAPAARDLAVLGVRYEVAARCRCYVPTEGAARTLVTPPRHLVENMHATPRPPLPVLRGVITVPVFGANGSVITRPGYDLASKLYYAPDAGLSIPAVPSHVSTADMAEARRLLLDELLLDFPFVDQADRAHAVAAILEQFVRELIDGPLPLHDIESAGPGSGKDLLAHVLAVPFVGRVLAVTAPAASEEEWRKKLTSVFRAARPFMLIDNVNRPLDSGVLAGALTARWWEDRPLGQTALLRAPVRCTFLLTGNNPIVSLELARRSVRSRLDPRVEQPWLREAGTFRHPDLHGWALAHRGELVWAVLVLVRSWLDAGRPPCMATLGSFEAWSRVIGGILAHARIPGFLGNITHLYTRADTEGAAWRALVTCWWETYQQAEVGTADLFTLATAVDGFDFGRATTERGQRTQFGIALARQEDRIIGGYRVLRAGTAQHAQLWCLLPAESPSPRGRERSPVSEPTGESGDESGEPSVNLAVTASQGSPKVHPGFASSEASEPPSEDQNGPEMALPAPLTGELVNLVNPVNLAHPTALSENIVHPPSERPEQPSMFSVCACNYPGPAG